MLSYSYLGQSFNSPNGWDGICPDLLIQVQCELLCFVQGHFGQYPESTIRSTILDFYREDEILGAKQVLIHATECVESFHLT